MRYTVKNSRTLELYNRQKNNRRLYRMNLIAKFLYEGTRRTQDIVDRLDAEYDIQVAKATIGHDIQDLDKMWLAHAIRDIEDLKAQTIAELNNVKAEYWAGYYRALEEQKETEKETRLGTEDGNKIDITIKKIKTKKSTGETKYLDGVLKVIKQQSLILGLNKPLEINVKQKVPMGGSYATIKRRFAEEIIEFNEGKTIEGSITELSDENEKEND